MKPGTNMPVAAAQRDHFQLLVPYSTLERRVRYTSRKLQRHKLDMTHANSQYKKLEAELIADARNGDIDAMGELFRRQYPISIAVARRVLPTQEDFLDAVQSAYLAAFRNFQSFHSEASFKTWITRIVLNQCLACLREPGRRRIALSLDQPGPDGTLPIIAVDSLTPEDLTSRAEIDRAVRDAAAKLHKPLRDVFIRCTISGLSIRDTASALGLTVPATKTRLFRARRLVRQKLQTTFAGKHAGQVKDHFSLVRTN
jgi:RNA polymerase sigma-70 factor (ECF subfamily)